MQLDIRFRKKANVDPTISSFIDPCRKLYVNWCKHCQFMGTIFMLHHLVMPDRIILSQFCTELFHDNDHHDNDHILSRAVTIQRCIDKSQSTSSQYDMRFYHSDIDMFTMHGNTPKYQETCLFIQLSDLTCPPYFHLSSNISQSEVTFYIAWLLL